jgi:hypothetical protein
MRQRRSAGAISLRRPVAGRIGGNVDFAGGVRRVA